MNIASFPLTAARALELIREAAGRSDFLIPDPPDGGEWYRVMSRRQVELCLKEGDMVGEPRVDEHGNVRCVLERFGAGLVVRVHVVLIKQHELWRIVVIEVENRL